MGIKFHENLYTLDGHMELPSGTYMKAPAAGSRETRPPGDLHSQPYTLFPRIEFL